jgi:hypothetical protein
MADVFEGFGGVLAADVEEDFFAASVCRMQTIRDHLLGNVFIFCNKPCKKGISHIGNATALIGKRGPGGCW